MFKVNNKNSRTRCEICSKLTIKIPERSQWRKNLFGYRLEHFFLWIESGVQLEIFQGMGDLLKEHGDKHFIYSIRKKKAPQEKILKSIMS